jgi:ferredoxin-NADP reductase
METMEVRVEAVREESEGVLSFDLRPPGGGALAPFAAGAHIDLHLPNGLIRSYSLCNAPGRCSHYMVCVNRDAASRGGSAYLHEQVKVGEMLKIGMPRNNFPLVEDAAHTVLIAGGIGITPLWSMVQRLQELGRSWQLFYAVRARCRAAFVKELERCERRARREGAPLAIGPILQFNASEEGRKRLDIAAIVHDAPPDTHFYCCGPLSMLEAFRAATVDLPPQQIHVEHFGHPGAGHPAGRHRESAPAAGGFVVDLAQSGCAVDVPLGTSILDAILDAGVRVPYACREGICGSCETRVLEGVPEHRDLVLSQAERDAGKVMMICCSGARTARLRLDC